MSLMEDLVGRGECLYSEAASWGIVSFGATGSETADEDVVRQ